MCVPFIPLSVPRKLPAQLPYFPRRASQVSSAGFKQEEGRCFRVQAKLAYAISFHAEFALKERVKSGAGKLDCVGQRLKQRCGADLRPLQAAELLRVRCNQLIFVQRERNGRDLKPDHPHAEERHCE